jgi:beta-mannosidase
MHTQSLIDKWQFREQGTVEWLPAWVPGCVHTDLIALGRIPDPFAGANELQVQWVADRDWEYRTGFQIDPELLAEERVFLVCDGLDTLADVTLDGSEVGHAENAFRQYRFDVKSILMESGGESELLITFPSPAAYIAEQLKKHPLRNPTQSIPGGPYLRKAPCQFGWDWGPKLPSVGIWKDIRLEGYTTARLGNVHLRQRHIGERITVGADIALERWQTADLIASLQLTAPDGRVQEAAAKLPGDATSVTLSIDIADPQLWWPNGYGSQLLYQAQVTLRQSERVCDERTYTIGLRTLELRQEEDEFGTSFTFVVNDVPIFAKGANWIPADAFPTRISDSHLEHLVRSAAVANMNMLRVWGGGFYEEDRFYDLCDRYGILVWQDFCFSCSIYPVDKTFTENVRAEAIDNIRRLRHRASLALWCGNNEMEWGWVAWGWENIRNSERFMDAYDRMFHRMLPKVRSVEDPDTPYWPSSPSSDTPFINPNGVHAGDTHNWEVWHQEKPFDAYRKHYSRFVSEFGFQSLPCLPTVRSFADEADWNMTSFIMEHHQRNQAGNRKIVTTLADRFRMPKDFESIIYLSQVLQAEAVRTGVEFWRRNRRCTSGTLYWQLNDCWPVASWSSLDHKGRWKVLHYAARRFYAPVLLSAEEGTAEDAPTATDLIDRVRVRWSAETPEGTNLADGVQFVGWETVQQFLTGGESPPKEWKPEATLFLTNDLAAEWQGAVRWSLETLAGEVLQAGEESVTVPPRSATQVCALDFAEQVTIENRREIVLVYEMWQGDERTGLGLMPFAPNKHLALAAPGLTTTVEKADEEYAIEITAERTARFVWLDLAETDAVFSDNYFDLPAGRTVTVTLPAMKRWSADRVQKALRVRSLVDSY